jgi:hypothetical protein
MKLRTIGLALAFVISSVSVFGADNPADGTWKQNLEQSKYDPGPAPNTPATITIESIEGGEKVSVEGTGVDGKSASWSYRVTYDGKPVSVKGSPYGDSVSMKRTDDQTTEIIYTKDGKVTRTSSRLVSDDGKTLTITATGTNAKGEKYNNLTVFDKQ